jgi:hypothetical protein
VEREDDFRKWSHIAEAGIVISAGALILAGFMDEPDEASRITITRSSYKARVYYGDLDMLSRYRLDGVDHCKVVLWPGEFTEVKVIKKHSLA